MKKMKNKGFTLIELLVVVLIIGILSAIAVPKYQLAVEKSRAAEAFTILKAIKQAEDVYFLANPNANTPTLSQLDVSLPNNSSTLQNFKIIIWPGGPHAQRKINNTTAYYLAYYDNQVNGGDVKGWYCILPATNPDLKYTKLCKSLGGVQDYICYDPCLNNPEACNDICFKLQ